MYRGHSFLRRGLAVRAKMGAPLPNNDPLDRGPAPAAGLPGSLVNLKEILKIPTPVNPVDAGTMMTDAPLQDDAYAFQKRFSLLTWYLAGNSVGMKPSQKQGFIGVDIAQPSQELLIHQKRLDLAAFRADSTVEISSSERLIEWFRTKPANHRLRIIDQPNTPKFARIVERQAQTSIHVKHQAVMNRKGCIGRFHPQITTHPQMHQQPIRGELKLEEFSPAAYSLDRLPDHPIVKFGGRWNSQGALP
jgi:hypothetical protein